MAKVKDKDMVTAPCAVCGTRFEVPPNQVELLVEDDLLLKDFDPVNKTEIIHAFVCLPRCPLCSRKDLAQSIRKAKVKTGQAIIGLIGTVTEAELPDPSEPSQL